MFVGYDRIGWTPIGVGEIGTTGVPTYVADSLGSASSSSTVSTVSATPSAGALVLCHVLATRGASVGTISISSDTFGDEMGDWTKIAEHEVNLSGLGFHVRVASFWAIAGSPSAGTVTASFPQAVGNAGIWLEQYPIGKYDDADPIAAADVAGNTSGSTISVDLGSLPAGASAHGWLVDIGNGPPAVGAGFTEIFSTASGVLSQYDLDPSDGVVDFSSLGGTGAAMIAFSVRAASDEGGADPEAALVGGKLLRGGLLTGRRLVG